MKVYLIESSSVILPFQALASELKLGGKSLKDRLHSQLLSLGAEIIFLKPEETLPATGSFLTIPTHFVCSTPFFEALLNKTRNCRAATQFQTDFEFHEVITSASSQTKTKDLPLFFYPSGFAKPVSEKICIQPRSLYRLPVRLPEEIYGKKECGIEFIDLFARPIESWVDFHLAANLVCRSYTAELIHRFRWVPQPILAKALETPFIAGRLNRIGKNCKIHPTARLEGCIIEDDVEIGAFCSLRASYVGRGSTIREHSLINLSHVGQNSFLMRTNFFQTIVGDSCFIVTEMLHNSCIGAKTFIGGGSGFSDLYLENKTVEVTLPHAKIDSDVRMLGSAVGENSFIGAGLIFKPGLTIPHGSKILSHQLIESAPDYPNGVFVAKGNRLIGIPSSMLQTVRSENS